MKLCIRYAAIWLLAAVCLLGLSSCDSGNGTLLSTSPATSSTTPQHLYVGNDNASGKILQYTLPITSSSTPVVSISAPNVVTVAVDSAGNLISGDYSGHISVFSAPLTNASTASATFNNGTGTNTGQFAFSSTGSLFVPTVNNRVNIFTSPLSSASTPSQSINDDSLSQALGAAFDASGNLIVSNTTGASSSTLSVYAPPYTGPPIVTPTVTGAAYRKLAVNGNQVFVTGASGSGRVDIYNLPLTASSAPVVTMTNVSIPEAIAFDSSGNMYVGNVNDATIRVFAPPFTATSAPTVTLTETGTFAIFGIAIGK